MVRVPTTAGMLDGLTESAGDAGQVTVFRGIPYAVAPVGRRRFLPPQPAPGWDGVRPAHRFGPGAPQPVGDPLNALVPGMSPASTDEDCLTLNVWSPAGSGPGDGRPVLVWIHGGAFVIGASSLATYDAAALAAAHDVVVVSINYRLGALGFLVVDGGHDERVLPSNRGLADQILALRWVQDNIAAFGGDPGRVTIFGESAGAGSVLHLLTAPAAGGLFRRAILQSPGVGHTLTAEQGREVADCFVNKLVAVTGGSRAAGHLAEAPLDALLAAQAAAAEELLGSVGAMPFHPVVDGNLVPDDPLSGLVAGRAAGTEILLGTTAEEMRLFLTPAMAALDRAAVVGMAADVATRLPAGTPDAATVVAGYEELLAGQRTAPADIWAAVMTDALMRLPAEAALDAQAAHQPATYAYTFTWAAPRSGRDLGACHALDLPFTFGTFDREGWDAFTGVDDDGRRLSAAMMASWAAFAATGDPSTPLVGTWPRYRSTQRSTMELGRRIGVLSDPLAACRALWQAQPVRP